MKNKKKISIILTLVLAFCLCASGVLAADIRYDKKKGNVIVTASERVRNLYTVGNMIGVEGNVTKDMLAAGNIVTVSGEVGDDLMLVSGTSVVDGDVKGSVRLASGNVLVNGKVSEDVIIMGGNIALSESSSVGGDLIIAGGLVDISAPVAGNIYLAGGQITINSRINGNVIARIQDSLKLGENAVISGSLKYRAPKEALINEKARVSGAIEYTPISITKLDWKESKKFVYGFLTIRFLIKLLSLIALGLGLVYLVNKLTDEATKNALAKFWSNLGLGMAGLILTPIVCFILLITVIGIKIAMLIGLAYILLLSLSCAFAAIILGRWLVKLIWKKDRYALDWRAVVIGVVVLVIVGIIPIVGWLVKLVFILIGFGALCQMSYKNIVSIKPFKLK